MAKKAAIEMSLGFIITVVISVILLGLVISFLTGAFGGINDISATMHNEAITKLRAAFAGGVGGDFTIYPPEYKTKPAVKIGVGAGIMNNAEDGEAHQYVVGVKLELPATSGIIVEWITAPKTIAINRDDNIPISFTIPAGTPKGNYLYRITACSDLESGTKRIVDLGTADTCTAISTNLWGASSKDFVLTVE